MAETALEAAPSAAPVTHAVEVDRGPLVNMTGEQRAEFRKTGKMPEQPSPQDPPKTEDAAPSDPPKAVATEDVDDPEASKPTQEQQPQQRQRKPDAEKRISDLTAETKRLRAELDTLRSKPAETKPEAKATEAPKPAEPQPTRPKPSLEAKDKDGKPMYSTYEDFVEDLSDWKAEQRLAQRDRNDAVQKQREQINGRLTEAKQRYGEKFDEILAPTVQTIVSDNGVSANVKDMLNESEVLPDLLFTIGSDPKEMSSFLDMAKNSPGKALRYIALTESLIREELAGKADDKGKEAPAPPKTSAPKPPAEVGGRAATPGDPLEAAAQQGDYRAFAAEMKRKALARLKAS